MKEQTIEQDEFLKEHGADALDYQLCKLCGRADWKDWGYELPGCSAVKEAKKAVISIVANSFLEVLEREAEKVEHSPLATSTSPEVIVMITEGCAGYCPCKVIANLIEAVKKEIE